MTLLAFRVFGGEIPREPETVLPENASQDAFNVDPSHRELRALRGDRTQVSAQTTIGGDVLRAIYTENGLDYWGWPFDVYAVKSLVVDDIHFRVYYTFTLADGTGLAKVARTKRNTDGKYDLVLGGLLVPQYSPPEYTTPGMPGGNPVGPDSWVLGVPAPKVQADIVEDNLAIELVDREEWPKAPALQLRVTCFFEDAGGNIVSQQDISNNETVGGFSNVFYTGAANATRGNKIQDMYWPLGGQHKPYKFYFFIPPALDVTGLVKPVTITNPGPNAASFDYDSSSTTPVVIPPKVIVA